MKAEGPRLGQLCIKFSRQEGSWGEGEGEFRENGRRDGGVGLIWARAAHYVPGVRTGH